MVEINTCISIRGMKHTGTCSYRKTINNQFWVVYTYRVLRGVMVVRVNAVFRCRIWVVSVNISRLDWNKILLWFRSVHLFKFCFCFIFSWFQLSVPTSLSESEFSFNCLRFRRVSFWAVSNKRSLSCAAFINISSPEFILRELNSKPPDVIRLDYFQRRVFLVSYHEIASCIKLCVGFFTFQLQEEFYCVNMEK